MSPDFSSRHPIKVRFLAALVLLLLAGPGQAQIANLLTAKPKNEAVKPAQMAVTVDPRTEAEKQLAEARHQQEAARLESGVAPDVAELPTNERQRLLDRLVVVHGERLKLLNDLEAVQKSGATAADPLVLAKEFAGPPPYSALRVDALRDDYGLIQERLANLAASERALEIQKRSLIDSQRRASEAVRLAEDKLARAKNEQDTEKESQKQKLASLRLQLIEAELANVALGVTRLHAEKTPLQASAGEMQALIARVLPGQNLSTDELEQQQTRLRDILAALTTEIDRRVAANTRHVAAREKLAKTATGADNSVDRTRQLALLDEKLETDRVDLLTLNWLQMVVETASDGWNQRYTALGGNDEAARQAAIAALSESKNQLTSRKELIHELESAARAEIREQELRLRSVLLDENAAIHESAVLDAQKARLLDYQRVSVAIERLASDLDRWLSDFGVSASPGDGAKWKLAGQKVAEQVKRMWNFELFSVEDSTVVDGKTVTSTYGVTIGKSIGVLFLYVLAYWVFSLISRWLERRMVSRLGINEQMASVIRRWAMIVLAILLIILILNLARIPLTVFAFMGGALAIGIGFGTQTIIKNVISGIIILFERKIRVGDIIALEGTTGYVTAVDLRASTVRSFDGVEALVPNSTFLEHQVINWTYSNSRIRREIRIGIAYGSPVRQAAEIITDCALEHGQVLADPAPEVFLEDFADSAVLMVLVFWVELGPNLLGRRVDSDLRFMMEKRLAAAGISIPFPQRDVHLSVADALPVRMMPGNSPDGDPA